MPEQKQSALPQLVDKGWTELEPPKTEDNDSVVGYYKEKPVKVPPITKEKTETYTSYKSGNYHVKIKNNELKVEVTEIKATKQYNEHDKPTTKIRKGTTNQCIATIPVSIVRELDIKRWQRIQYIPKHETKDGESKIALDMKLIGDVYTLNKNDTEIRLVAHKIHDRINIDIEIQGENPKEGHLIIKADPPPTQFDTPFTINEEKVTFDSTGKAKYIPTNKETISLGFEDFEPTAEFEIDWSKNKEKRLLTIKKPYIQWRIGNYRGNRGYLDKLDDTPALVLGSKLWKETDTGNKDVEYAKLEGNQIAAISLPENVFNDLLEDVKTWETIEHTTPIKSVWSYETNKNSKGHMANLPSNLEKLIEGEGKQLTWEIQNQDKLKTYVDISEENKLA